jgi:hypothetical protein
LDPQVRPVLRQKLDEVVAVEHRSKMLREGEGQGKHTRRRGNEQ